VRVNCQDVARTSNGHRLAGALFAPEIRSPSLALLICHGALEFKEHCLEPAETLASTGIGALAIAMHGHAASGGGRFRVDMSVWAADVLAAISFLETCAGVDSSGIGGFRIFSGGTVILEAALIEPRLKFLIALDATEGSIMTFGEGLAFRLLEIVGTVKRALTGRDLRPSWEKTPRTLQAASGPEACKPLASDPRLIDAHSAFPLPGAFRCFIVNTLERVGRISCPALLPRGTEHRLGPPGTARLLSDALSGEKRLEILPDSGHVGVLGRQKSQVMQ
jgi:pimeloyl-ACP methyl ester carboxylesterase